MKRDKITRRKFVAGTTGAAVGAMILPRHVLGGPGYVAPSDKLNVAVVGCGGQGASDASELVAGGENIVALADVDFGYVDRAVAERTREKDGKPNERMVKLQEAYGKAKRYDDFRKMLDQQKDIDAVLVATPDHIHAADLVCPRSPHAARDGEEESQTRHADGQPGTFEPRGAFDQRMDSSRHHRPCAPSLRLD
jgi:hypothetical protein